MVEFQDETKFRKEVHISNLIKGYVDNPYNRSREGIGYIGDGAYRASINGIKTRSYNEWGNMLKRCYSEKSLLEYPKYRECTVDHRWHNYQNFAEWWENHYYNVNNEIMHLDKDILVRGNKIYHPDRCCIIPQRINTMLISGRKRDGWIHSGIMRRKNGRYQSYCGVGGGKTRYIGCYDTQEDAFLAYKSTKENYIKEVADQYKNSLPENVYDALYNWTVELED